MKDFLPSTAYCRLPTAYCSSRSLLDDDADALFADDDFERVAELDGDGLAVDVDFERRHRGRCGRSRVGGVGRLGRPRGRADPLCAALLAAGARGALG